MKLKTVTSILTVSAFAAIIPFTLNAQRPERSESGERPPVEEMGESLRGGPHASQGRRGHGRPNNDKLIAFWENEEVVGKLSLTEDQVALLDVSMAEAKDALDGQKEALHTEMEELKALLDADSPELNEVYDQLDQISVLKTDIVKITTGHRVAVKNILSAEQEVILKEGIRSRIQERVGKIRDRRQGRGERGDGPPSDLPALENGEGRQGDKAAGDSPRKRGNKQNRS